MRTDRTVSLEATRRIIHHHSAAPEHQASSEHNSLGSCADTVFPSHFSPRFLSSPKIQLTLSRHSLPSPGCQCPQEISGRNSFGSELEAEAGQRREQCLGFENSWSCRGRKAAWQMRKECACHFKRKETSISLLPLPTSVYWKGQMVVMAGDFWLKFYGIFHVYFTFSKSR